MNQPSLFWVDDEIRETIVAPDRPKKARLPLTELTDLELAILRKLSGARFPPATASKRFVRDLTSVVDAGLAARLSDRGRSFLAFIVHRFRRQYTLNTEEQRWLAEWFKPQGGRA